MSARYTALPKSTELSSLDSEDESVTKITPYIPAKRKTVYFDICVLAILTVIFVIVLGIVMKYWAYPKFHSYSLNHKLGTTQAWMTNYTKTGSESVVRLFDVNGDGADDVIFGIAHLTYNQQSSGQKEYCKLYEYGCLGAVLAIDGKDGSQIWAIETKHEIFELNCGNIDINKDGKLDCLGAGRKGAFLAFDPFSGEMLWNPQNGTEKYIDNAWNIYNPLVLDDITDDGVPEVLLSHGGDPDFPPENSSRYPGRLLLLDGATGQYVGSLSMPDGKETYNSPVLHQDDEGIKYILIGTGGETVSGNLLIIRLDEFFQRSRQVSVKSEHQQIGNLAYLKDGFHIITSTKSKGVMVPVVLVDITHDETNDIIVTTFDGGILAFDGNSFSQIWSSVIDNAESYTTPGIGYFNQDQYLDIAMHWNWGEWPFYNKSALIIHSGKDGNILWMYNTSRFSMTSDLVLRTDREYQDVFVFRIQGRHGKPVDSGIGVIHGINPQRALVSNTTNDSGEDLCTDNLDIFASEVFMVDWSSRNAPRRVFRRNVDKFYYDPTESKPNPLETRKRRALVTERSTTHNKCAIMEQSSRTTGAVGDLDNDGNLDLVLTFNAQGVLKNLNGGYIKTVSSLDLVRLDIQKDYNLYPRISTTSDKTSSNTEQKFKFFPKGDQIWTGYMGNNSKSTYYITST